MSLLTPVGYDNLLQRRVAPGDIMLGGEQAQSLTTVGAGTLTAALLLSGIINRTGPVGAFNETTDTAANIIAAMVANTQFQGSGAITPQGIQPGTTWRLRYINGVAFVATLVAGTGVTLVGTTTVAASSIKEFLLTVTNGTPTQIYAANQVTGTAVITGLSAAQTQNLTVGMAVTGTNIAASSVIASIQPGVGVTLNNNTTATLNLNALTFAPTVSITSLGQLAA
jgi:hypothetical protein